jgi:hypothetical protein
MFAAADCGFGGSGLIAPKLRVALISGLADIGDTSSFDAMHEDWMRTGLGDVQGCPWQRPGCQCISLSRYARMLCTQGL